MTISGFPWLFAALCGCQPAPNIEFKHSANISPQVRAETQSIANDPRAFLVTTRDRCSKIPEYEVDFCKQERRGLFKELKPEEHMRVKFRAQPFSVMMTMLDPEADFSETLYVEGKNQNRLRCQWRKSLWPGAAPPVDDYDPRLAVATGRSISPITDFGIARLMERIVETMEKYTDRGLPPKIEYLGTTDLEQDKLPVHHIQLVYNERTGLKRRKVDLLVYADSLLPAAVYLWETDGRLAARYVYTNFDLNPGFVDKDFRIPSGADREQKSR